MTSSTHSHTHARTHTHTHTHSDPNCCLSPAGWDNRLPEGIFLPLVSSHFFFFCYIPSLSSLSFSHLLASHFLFPLLSLRCSFLVMFHTLSSLRFVLFVFPSALFVSYHTISCLRPGDLLKRMQGKKEYRTVNKETYNLTYRHAWLKCGAKWKSKYQQSLTLTQWLGHMSCERHKRKKKVGRERRR